MALTIPATLELLDDNALIGHMPTGLEPLDTIMRRSNWHYARHAPTLVNVCPVVSVAASNQITVPAYASADSLTYEAQFAVYIVTTGTIDVTIEHGATDTGSWTNVTGSPFTTASLTGATTASFSLTFPLPSTCRFLRITVDNGAGNLQLQNVGIYPDVITSIPSGLRFSGFIGYDDAALKVGSGDAPIHTEYFNRSAANHRAVQADRRQCVASFAQDSSAYVERWTGMSQESVQRIFLCPYWLGSTKTETVTVYCRADDTGTPNGNIVVGQVGSSYLPATFSANGTGGSKVITLDPQAPAALYANAVDGATAIEVDYIFVEWSPDIGSTDDVISNPAPPPLREYLATIEDFSLESILAPYAVCGLNFDPSITGAAGGSWEWGYRVGPAVRAMQARCTKSTDEGSAAANIPGFYNQSSGVTAADLITFPVEFSGSDVYPPSPSAQVIYGSEQWTPAPVATGEPRLAELTKQRTPAWERFNGDFFQAFGGRTFEVEDLAALP